MTLRPGIGPPGAHADTRPTGARHPSAAAVACSKHRRHPDRRSSTAGVPADHGLPAAFSVAAAGPHAGAPHHAAAASRSPMTALHRLADLVQRSRAGSGLDAVVQQRLFTTGRADKPISEPTKGLWSMSTTRGDTITTGEQRAVGLATQAGRPGYRSAWHRRPRRLPPPMSAARRPKSLADAAVA